MTSAKEIQKVIDKLVQEQDKLEEKINDLEDYKDRLEEKVEIEEFFHNLPLIVEKFNKAKWQSDESIGSRRNPHTNNWQRPMAVYKCDVSLKYDNINATLYQFADDQWGVDYRIDHYHTTQYPRKFKGSLEAAKSWTKKEVYRRALKVKQKVQDEIDEIEQLKLPHQKLFKSKVK